jgi:hypothetical protein
MFPGSISIDEIFNCADLAGQVTAAGWMHADVAEVCDDLELRVERIAKLLGEPIKGRAGRLVDALAPMDKEKAKPSSLSVIHGLGAFPFHTDGAHLLQPPRFLVLICAAPGAAPEPTTLVRFQDLKLGPAERGSLEATPFLFRNGQRSFYSTIYTSTRPFIRFDEGCMVPTGPEGRRAMAAIADYARGANWSAVHWRAGGVLIIDNWNVMHGRGSAGSEASVDRLILRSSVR